MVILLGFGVEHLARVTESTDADSGVAEQRSLVLAIQFHSAGSTWTVQEIQRMELFAGMLQQALNVAESFDVFQRKTGVAIADGPEFTVADEYAFLLAGNFLRHGMAPTLR